MSSIKSVKSVNLDFDDDDKPSICPPIGARLAAVKIEVTSASSLNASLVEDEGAAGLRASPQSAT